MKDEEKYALVLDDTDYDPNMDFYKISPEERERLRKEALEEMKSDK